MATQNKFEIYVTDCETTGLDYIKNEPVEVSIYRLSNGEQRTWCIKPINFEYISSEALRVNGIKLEDLKWETEEGKKKFREPSKVLVEIENWLANDFMASGDRILLGQNINFDKMMLEGLWNKCNSLETYPFNRKYSMDTMQVQFFLDYCGGQFAEGYSLSMLTKKYGVKNERAHTAAADVKATVGVFGKQVETVRKLLEKVK